MYYGQNLKDYKIEGEFKTISHQSWAFIKKIEQVYDLKKKKNSVMCQIHPPLTLLLVELPQTTTIQIPLHNKNIVKMLTLPILEFHMKSKKIIF